ncbi:MAG TPA: hypothetical protein PLT55_03770 [Acidimicrobiia bacterium]|nr:hypothetical protein [Acidimicrobiia bacterium]
MRIADLEKLPLARLNVRGLVKCQGLYVFLKRTKHGSTKPYIYCPGGRVEPSDRVMIPGKSDLEATLRNSLVRQIKSDLAAQNVVLGEFIGISKMHNHSRDVLFYAEVDIFNFELRTSFDTINYNLGEIECITMGKVDKDLLARRETSFFPKEWRKPIGEFVRNKRT